MKDEVLEQVAALVETNPGNAPCVWVGSRWISPSAIITAAAIRALKSEKYQVEQTEQIEYLSLLGLIKDTPLVANTEAPMLVSYNDMARQIGLTNQTLVAENKKLKEALRGIARQKKTDELDAEHDVESASFEDGFDTVVDLARAALGEDK